MASRVIIQVPTSITPQAHSMPWIGACLRRMVWFLVVVVIVVVFVATAAARLHGLRIIIIIVIIMMFFSLRLVLSSSLRWHHITFATYTTQAQRFRFSSCSFFLLLLLHHIFRWPGRWLTICGFRSIISESRRRRMYALYCIGPSINSKIIVIYSHRNNHSVKVFQPLKFTSFCVENPLQRLLIFFYKKKLQKNTTAVVFRSCDIYNLSSLLNTMKSTKLYRIITCYVLWQAHRHHITNKHGFWLLIVFKKTDSVV